MVHLPSFHIARARRAGSWRLAQAFSLFCALFVGTSATAYADDTRVASRFAQPPFSGHDDPDPEPEPDDPTPHSQPKEVSLVRLEVGPLVALAPDGIQAGVGAGLAIGRGPLGARISSSWSQSATHSEGTLASVLSELTVDVRRRGPIHPVLGVGVGVLHADRVNGASGFAGAGVMSFTLEIALPIEATDVRAGAILLGGLIGPRDRELADVRGFVTGGLRLAVGF